MGVSDSKEHWEEDERHPNCSKCHKGFTVTIRRHHCRSCGGVFCSDCSRFKGRVPARGIPDVVRLCQDCHVGTAEIQSKHTEREQHYMQGKQRSGLSNSDRKLEDSKRPPAQPIEPTVQPIVQTNVLAAIKDRANKQYADVNCSLAPIDEFSAPSEVQFEFSCGVENGALFELEFPEPAYSTDAILSMLSYVDAKGGHDGVCRTSLTKVGSAFHTVTNRSLLTYY
jgi:hypothetical protein